MNIEIKFRAWDKSTNSMFENIQNHINDKVFAFGKMLNNDRFVIMQFTRLKDKNGKEIYEGDVFNHGFFRKVIVVWNENICAFQYAYHAIGKGTGIGGRITGTLYKHESESRYEVIGNVYENPELLTN